VTRALLRIVIALAVLVLAGAASASVDGPAGFRFGSDSWPMSVGGSGPYTEPVIGGIYGGYVGMAGNWARWQGCGDKIAWSAADSAAANANFHTYHRGIGTGVYWFMAGPGVDPAYDGSQAEAFAWGKAQAARALHSIRSRNLDVTYPIVFADVELPGNAPGISPAPDNGWNAVYTSPCSGRIATTYVAPLLDRADLFGFFRYLGHHSAYVRGVYSSAPVWKQIFGTGSAAALSGVYEWTYESATSSLDRLPYGWCLRGTTTCAHFFGGVSRNDPVAVMWQWSGGGGTSNGFGDFDQIDEARTP